MHKHRWSYKSRLLSHISVQCLHALPLNRQADRTLRIRALKAVHAFARTHAIPCDSWTGDTVDIIYSQAQWDASMKGVSAIREAFKGEDDERTVARYEIWSREEAVRKWCVDVEGVVGAVSYEAGSLSAYKFVIGVLKFCLQKGLQLYTNMPAMKLHKTSHGSWEVETAKGAIGAKQVILATNGYTAFLHAAFQGCIVPLRGQVTAHRPVFTACPRHLSINQRSQITISTRVIPNPSQGSNTPQEGLPGTYSFIHSSGYEYMIPRPPGCKSAGDIIIGGGLTQAGEEGLSEYGETDDGRVNERMSAYLTASTKMYFGERWGDDDREGRVRGEWTGVMGYSSDGYPFVGEVPFAGGGGGGRRGLWVCASFQGHGMVLCWESGRALVDIMRGGGRGTEGFLPECFLVSEERMKMRFRGRLITKVGKVDGRL
ncbi:uncharacterized protein RAG0_09577 [Rhynchosporium agropyri]|uniref:FAD dependent oxidoreductase domain-containing protein n=1 Tax=Rhynchosporium agropyri TaxID=914238 RepID=A0A1E1KYZ2_9HELO|nr:uncharacterized protein RAG0_09577 [Rhynchosporium agropyri]